MAAEPGVSCIIIKGIPSTVTPILTPTPIWANAGLTYETDGWYARFLSPGASPKDSGTITYTVSASGYASQNVIINGDTITTITLLPSNLYAWTNNDGTVYTNTLNITDSETLTTNDGNGTIIYDNTGNKISFVIGHSSNTITKTSHTGGSND